MVSLLTLWHGTTVDTVACNMVPLSTLGHSSYIPLAVNTMAWYTTPQQHYGMNMILRTNHCQHYGVISLHVEFYGALHVPTSDKPSLPA